MNSMSINKTALRRLTSISRQIAAPNNEPLPLAFQACAADMGQPLAGKVAIITGSGKGIGEAAAKLLASQGAFIVVADLDGTAAEQVASAIKASGGKAITVAGDITNPEVPGRIVKAALDAFKRIDIIVNNAGFTWDGVIHKMSPEQWETMLSVHCTAPFRLIQAAGQYIREAAKQEASSQGTPSPRSIINISSTTGTHGNAGQANYATAKAGIIGLTKAVAKEWGPLNVRCNAIAYGLIDTRLTRPKESGESIQVGGKSVALGIPSASDYWKNVMAAVPLKRLGTVEDAAGAIMMLVSPWSAYITGQVIEVNGGAFM